MPCAGPTRDATQRREKMGSLKKQNKKYSKNAHQLQKEKKERLDLLLYTRG